MGGYPLSTSQPSGLDEVSSQGSPERICSMCRKVMSDFLGSFNLECVFRKEIQQSLVDTLDATFLQGKTNKCGNKALGNRLEQNFLLNGSTIEILFRNQLAIFYPPVR